jgi:hypothetical protein
MTKKELETLVRYIYATFNVQLMKVDEKTVLRAWWNMLDDLEYDVAADAFTNLAIYADFLPRPGEVRRAAIDLMVGEDMYPEPATAWGILQAMRKATEGGQFYEGERPEPLMQTIEMLGSSAFDMHTNGDRETFVRVYSKVIEKAQQKKYHKRNKLTVVDEEF